MRYSSVEFYGDWAAFDAWLLRKQNIAFVLEDLKDPAEKLAIAIQRKAREMMKSREPTWPPLSPSTVHKKGHDQPFIDTLAYYESIMYRINETEDSLVILVGPEEGATAEGGFYDYQYIGTQLEFGTSTIPARPLWRPLTKRIPQMPEFRTCLESVFADFMR